MLESLAATREDMARAKDLPPQRIIGDVTANLTELAGGVLRSRVEKK